MIGTGAEGDTMRRESRFYREPVSGGVTSTRVALCAFVLVELIALVLWIRLGRTEWFFADEWAFLAGRDAFDAHDLLRDHGTHWSTVPILVYRLLWTLFGIGSYLPYVALLVALHLAVAALLRVVMRRAGVHPWIATSAASLFALYGTGYQNIVWAFQIGFVGALVFGLTHLILADHDGPIGRRDLVGLAAGLAAIMTAGVGVTMVAATTFAVCIRRGWRPALLHGGPLAVVYVVWWAAVVRGEEHPGVDTSDLTPGEVAEFVKIGIQHAFDNLVQSGALAFVLAALFVGGLVLAARGPDTAARRRCLAVPVGLALGAGVFLVMSGIGRVGVAGPQFAQAPRYQHVVAALLLPGIAVALTALARRWRVTLPLLCALLLIGIPGNVDTLADFTRGRRETVRVFRNEILGIPRSAEARQVPRNLRPETAQIYGDSMTVGWLLDGAASGRVPDPGPLSDNEAARVRFRLTFLKRSADGVVPTNCVPAGDGIARHFEKGDRMYFTSVANTIVQLSPGTGPADAAARFKAKDGALLVAALGPVDVVIRQGNPYFPVTVCDAVG